MSTLLDTLQNKSDAEKAFFALAVSVFITVCLFATWGYTVAHSGKLNTLVGGASNSVASVATVVDESGIMTEFSRAFDQLRILSGEVQEASLATTTDDVSAGGQQINVFATPIEDGFNDPVPGENPADVLY
jgi:hypothetical protein